MLIGGSYTINPQGSNKTWFFNHQNERWIPGPDLGTGRCYHTAGIVKDRETNEEFVAVVGGYYDDDNLQSVELLNLHSKENASWSYGIEFKNYISKILVFD